MIGLVALTNFTHDGVARRKGEYFETIPVQAAVLTRQLKAKFGAKPDEPRRRRTYQRRDMVAESTTFAEPADS